MLNLTQLKSKLIWIVPLVVIILLATLAIGIFQKKEPTKVSTKQSPINQPLIIPPEERSPLPQTLNDIKETIIASQIAEERGDIVLYSSSFYKIDYVPTADLFVVSIYEDPAEDAKKQATDWFQNFGISDDDICKLTIRFVLFNIELKQANPNFSPFPKGC